MNGKQQPNSDLYSSKTLSEYLKQKKIWHKFYEFDSAVKTAQQTENQGIDRKRIIKSLVFVDYNQTPFVAIINAVKKADFQKIKKFLKVRDVRLANAEEVRKYSGYEVGVVPPVNYKNIDLVLIDVDASRMKIGVGGGGDIDKLIEMKIEDIMNLDKAVIADISGD